MAGSGWGPRPYGTENPGEMTTLDKILAPLVTGSIGSRVPLPGSFRAPRPGEIPAPTPTPTPVPVNENEEGRRRLDRETALAPLPRPGLPVLMPTPAPSTIAFNERRPGAMTPLERVLAPIVADDSEPSPGTPLSGLGHSTLNALMTPFESAVAAPKTESTATTATMPPRVAGPPIPDFRGSGSGSSAPLGSSAGSGSNPNPIRAVRMPNGQILFTNRPTGNMGGNEITRGQAGREVRQADAQTIARLPEQHKVPSAMSELVRRSAEQELARSASNPDYNPDEQWGASGATGVAGFSAGAGATEETQQRAADERAFETGSRQLGLMELEQAQKRASLSPEEVAQLSRPPVANLEIARQVFPRIQAADAKRQKATQDLLASQAIPDPKLRTQAVAQAKQDIQNAETEIEYILVSYGLKPPPQF